MESTKDNQLNTAEEDRPFSNIGRKSFFMVVGLLLAIITLSGILTYLIPQGQYVRDEAGMIINGTYTAGEVQGLPIWRILTAPFRVFVSSDALTIIMISVFLLVMSGVFNLLEKTEGMRVIIGKTVSRFSDSKRIVVFVVAFVFMAVGSFFGMF